MLELLAKYAREHGLEVEPGFKPKDVRWAIVCDSEGKFLEVIELGEAGQKRNRGQTFPKCPELSFPELVSGSETRCHFLVESGEVVAGYGKKADDTKVRDKHEYFLRLLSDAAPAMPQLGSLAEQLRDDEVLARIAQRLGAQKAKPSDKVTFRVGSDFPVESSAWHDWWRQFRRGFAASKPSRKAKGGDAQTAHTMRCFITGQSVEASPTHLKIEGLADVGGLPTGDVLVGFDKDAFCSYGLSQSANAAVSEEAMCAYRAALNELIKSHGQRLAGAKVVHWFKAEVPHGEDVLAWLEEPPEQQERNAQQLARELLESIQSGKRADLLDNYFYALNLSGAAGRVMVRDWIEGQFSELAQNISDWFSDLAIVHRDGGGPAPAPKFLAVLGATVRNLDDLSPPFVAKMWRVAVRGEPIPETALAHALARARVGILQDEPFNHARMGLLKAYHVRNERVKGGEVMSQELGPFMNEAHPHPAYQCGRLMAVLAGLQRAALGDVGAGVVQRYYAAASSTPALVFGRLTRLSQFHLSKLEPGLTHWYEAKIAGTWGRIKDSVPKTLTLEEQSLFALGYYQQMADMRTKKSKEEAHE
jgi:CRISPR-associated protein Csd1